MIFPPPPSPFLPLSAPLDGHFLGALLAPLLRPKYRLIVFEAEISLGWGRPAGGAREARKSREEGALDDGVCHPDDDDDDRAKL